MAITPTWEDTTAFAPVVPQTQEPQQQQPVSETAEPVWGDTTEFVEPKPEPTMWESTKEFFTGEDRETRGTRELPELGSGGLLSNKSIGETTKAALATAITMDPRELANILGQIEGIGITEDEKGNLYANNNETGVQVVINKPGVSKLDLIQGLGLAAMYTPAGRVVGTGAKLGTKMLLGGAAMGTTETAIQTGQAALGGEFDTEDVAIATGIGVLAPLAKPVLSTLKAKWPKVSIPKVKAPQLGNGRTVAVIKDLIKENLPKTPTEAMIQIAGHYVFPGGGMVAQKAMRVATNLLKKQAVKPLTKKEAKALALAEAELKVAELKAQVKQIKTGKKKLKASNKKGK